MCVNLQEYDRERLYMKNKIGNKTCLEALLDLNIGMIKFFYNRRQ